LNTRLLGAAVLIALAVLFVPMFFSRTPPAGGDQSISLAIPPSPDGELQTRTMSLNPQVPSTVAAASARSAAPAVSGDQLATVNIGSNRPLDVETDPRAGKPHEPTTVTMGSGTSPSQPIIPMQGGAPKAGNATPAATPLAPKPAAAEPKAAAPAPAPAAPAVAAGDGAYQVNLGAYANAGNVASLRREVQALGYPSSTQAVTLGGKQLTQVAAGPFDTRTAAETARLKIAQKVQGVRPTLDRTASAPQAAAPAAASASATKAGGWAVQLAALSNEADANALRDKLRAGGFDGYVNPVRSGSARLWQVRAGPLTQHADAERVQAQIKAKLGIDGVIRRVP